MRYRKLDSNGDMQFGGQQSDFYRDVPEAPAQAVLTRLLLVAGEWYIDMSQGTPYQGGILGKYTSDSAEPIIRDRILGTQGITAILSYDHDFDADSREYFVRAEIDTLYGPAVFQGVI